MDAIYSSLSLCSYLFSKQFSGEREAILEPAPYIKTTKEFMSLPYKRGARSSTSIKKVTKMPGMFELVEHEATCAVHVDMDVEKKDGEQSPVSVPGHKSCVGKGSEVPGSERPSQSGACFRGSGCHVHDKPGSKFSSVSYSSHIIFATPKSRSTDICLCLPHRRPSLCSPSKTPVADVGALFSASSTQQQSQQRSPPLTPPALAADSGCNTDSSDSDIPEMSHPFPFHSELVESTILKTDSTSRDQQQQEHGHWDNETLHWRMPGEDDQGQAARAALYEYPDVEDSDIDVDTDVPIPSQPSSPLVVKTAEPQPKPVLALPSSATRDAIVSKPQPLSKSLPEPPPLPTSPTLTKKKPVKKLEWDWALEHADRTRESRLDAAGGVGDIFQIDRKALRDVVKEKMGGEVARIRFISSGTFHKAYLVTLAYPATDFSSSPSSVPTYKKVIFRAARRFMPRLKTASEVATLKYLREHTSVPVPEVFAWDENLYNRVGGEWILMSRAPGIPLRRVYQSLPHKQLVALLSNLSRMLIPLFGHRFSHIGSLYEGKGDFNSGVTLPAPRPVQSFTHLSSLDHHEDHVQTPTAESAARARSILGLGGKGKDVEFAFGSSLPTPTHMPSGPFPLTLSLNGADTPKARLPPRMSRSGSVDVEGTSNLLSSLLTSAAQLSLSEIQLQQSALFHIGPIISWPFFGSHRGDLSHTSIPPEIERGPWASSAAYYRACVEREAKGVERENEGRAKPHRLHLDPDEVRVKERGRTAGRERGRAGGGPPEKGKGIKKGKGEYIWGYGYVRRTHLGGGYGMEGDSDSSSESEDEDEVASSSSSDSDSSDDASPARSLSSASASSLNSDDDEDTMYRDYRRFQRSTFLVAELSRRERQVRGEMGRWERCMTKLEEVLSEVREAAAVGGPGKDKEAFGLDCHDLSLDNVFVDENDPSKITCIIDWESTTTRPLWACAHLPSFLLPSPFASSLFRKAVAALSKDEYPQAFEWLLLERAGAPLRYAHKCAEWDGWEEGLVHGILGDVEVEEEAEAHVDSPAPSMDAGPGTFVGIGVNAMPLRLLDPVQSSSHTHVESKEPWEREGFEERLVQQMRENFLSPAALAQLRHPHSSTRLTKLKLPIPTGAVVLPGVKGGVGGVGIEKARSPNAVDGVAVGAAGAGARRASHGSVSAASELEMERMLDVRGDECGGRGGELGRRLEAWLVEVEDEDLANPAVSSHPASFPHHNDGHSRARVEVA